jgi:hypothetical protein
LRKKGDVDGVADIDNEIMGIICGGLSANEGGWPHPGLFPAHHGADLVRIARLEVYYQSQKFSFKVVHSYN